MNASLVFQYGPDISADCTLAAQRWESFAAEKLALAVYEESRGDADSGASARRLAEHAKNAAAGLRARANAALAQGR